MKYTIKKNESAAKDFAVDYFQKLTNQKVSAFPLKIDAAQCGCGESRAVVFMIECDEKLFNEVNESGNSVIKITICPNCADKF